MYNKVTCHSGISSCPVQSFIFRKQCLVSATRRCYQSSNQRVWQEFRVCWPAMLPCLAPTWVKWRIAELYFRIQIWLTLKSGGLHSKILGYICFEIISEVLSNRILQSCMHFILKNDHCVIQPVYWTMIMMWTVHKIWINDDRKNE